jgi:hypothetical protein
MKMVRMLIGFRPLTQHVTDPLTFVVQCFVLDLCALKETALPGRSVLFNGALVQLH